VRRRFEDGRAIDDVVRIQHDAGMPVADQPDMSGERWLRIRLGRSSSISGVLSVAKNDGDRHMYALRTRFIAASERLSLGLGARQSAVEFRNSRPLVEERLPVVGHSPVIPARRRSDCHQ
jgi:hypothetical protein